MKKLIFILLTALAMNAWAQEPLMPLLPEQDSARLAAERSVMYRNLLGGITPTGELMEIPQLPEFDFNQELTSRWNYNLSGLALNRWDYFQPGFWSFAPSPFLSHATIFSEGRLQLNEKLRLGGYSYGGNSVFTAPFPNQGLNNYDTRGSTLFMQYKVSKNFKIETRVNVIRGPTP